MKRIAAMAALVITMLAVPATAALASTGGPGSTLTEVSGPALAPTQEYSDDGDTYTIMSVNPDADSFTVFKDGFLFVNQGTAITGGTGVICCAR